MLLRNIFPAIFSLNASIGTVIVKNFTEEVLPDQKTLLGNIFPVIFSLNASHQQLWYKLLIIPGNFEQVSEIKQTLNLCILVTPKQVLWQTVKIQMQFCKSGNFREIYIFTISAKRHICDAKSLRLGHDLPISVNDRVLSPFREDFIFAKLRMCEVS